MVALLPRDWHLSLGIVLVSFALMFAGCSGQTRIDYPIDSLDDFKLDELLMLTAEALDCHVGDFKIGMTQINIAPDASLSFLSIYMHVGNKKYDIRYEKDNGEFIAEAISPSEPLTHVTARELFSRIASGGHLAGIIEAVDATMPLEAWLRFASKPVSSSALPNDHRVYHMDQGTLEPVGDGFIRDGIILEILSYRTDVQVSIVLVGWEDAD